MEKGNPRIKRKNRNYEKANRQGKRNTRRTQNKIKRNK